MRVCKSAGYGAAMKFWTTRKQILVALESRLRKCDKFPSAMQMNSLVEEVCHQYDSWWSYYMEISDKQYNRLVNEAKRNVKNLAKYTTV